MNNPNYGTLLHESDIKLHRNWFKQMCGLIGINVIYRAPRPSKTYTTYAELDTNYQEPEVIGCIFEEHPKQDTLKKLGWVAELQENASIIHVAYDTKDLQKGSLFLIPSGIDNSKGRLFKVAKMSTEFIYPASVACEIVPEYEDTYDKSQSEFKHQSFTLLNEEEDD